MASGTTSERGMAEELLLVRLVGVFIPFIVAVSWRGLTRSRAEKLLAIVVLSTAIALAVGVVLHLVGIEMSPTQQRLYVEGEGVVSRAGGLFGNTGTFGHTASIVFVLAIVAGVYFAWPRRWIIGATGLSILAVYVSASRAGFLRIALFCLIILIHILRGRRAAWLIPLGLLATILGLVSLRSLELSAEAAVTLRRFDILNLSGHSNFESAVRTDQTWAPLWEILNQSPIFGVGPGRAGVGDNSALVITAELGLIAGALFVGFWIALVVDIGRANSVWLRVGGIAIVVSEMAHVLTVDTHRMWATTPLLLVGVAIVVRLGQMSRPEADDATRFERDRSSARPGLESIRTLSG